LVTSDLDEGNTLGLVVVVVEMETVRFCMVVICMEIHVKEEDLGWCSLLIRRVKDVGVLSR